MSRSYRTVVADPPWRYRQQRILTTPKRRPETRPEADAQYQTLTIEDIAALPVRNWAADDAHLYLWVTNPKLPEVWPVLAAWGFEYVTLAAPKVGHSIIYIDGKPDWSDKEPARARVAGYGGSLIHHAITLPAPPPHKRLPRQPLGRAKKEPSHD